MYYWRIKLYGGDDLLVSPEVAEQFKRHIKEKKEHVDYRGTLVAVRNISMIEQTFDMIPSQTKQIESGPVSGPVVNQMGEIEFRWVKKRVSTRDWNNYYVHHPGYKLLKMHDNGTDIAFKTPSHLSAQEGTELLTAEELRVLGEAASAVTA